MAALVFVAFLVRRVSDKKVVKRFNNLGVITNETSVISRKTKKTTEVPDV